MIVFWINDSGIAGSHETDINYNVETTMQVWRN